MQGLEGFFAHVLHYVIYLLLMIIGFAGFKSGLWTEVYHKVRRNKVFFFVVISLGVLVSLKCFPFAPLVYYDEQNYLVGAQNIIENHVNALCVQSEQGMCMSFSIAPHGMGASALGALVYHPQANSLYRRISLLNLVLYAFNAILLFVIAERLFGNRSVAQICAVLVLFLPQNIIQATNIMPETLAHTFFLLALHAFLGLQDNTAVTKYPLELLFASLIVLSSIRVEYIFLLGIAILATASYLLREGHIHRQLNPSFLNLLMAGFLLAATIVLFLYAAYYRNQKLLGGSLFGPEFLNASYLRYYASTVSFVILSVSFLVYWISFANRKVRQPAMDGKDKVKLFFIALFAAFLAFFSSYNYQGVYRFLVPATSLYILFAAAGLNLLVRKILFHRVTIALTLAFLLALFSADFAQNAFQMKARQIEENQCNAHFLNVIQRANLAKFLGPRLDNSTFYFRAAYLGQVTRISNYMEQENEAKATLEQGNPLYYVNSAFEHITDSAFRSAAYEQVYNDSSCGFHIYRVTSQ